MTTLDELEQAVERVEALVVTFGSSTHYDDLRLLLSERAELLATVERMRGGLEKITTNYGPGHLAHQIARATGEAS